MIRKHEKPIAFRAGVLTMLVHGVLLLLLFFSIHWKSVQPMQIATVELWDHLPSKPSVRPISEPKVEPEIKPEVKTDPLPEQKAEPEPPAKIDIQVKKNPPKSKVETKKKELEKKPEPSPVESKNEDELKKLQESLLQEDSHLSKQDRPKSSPPAEVKSSVAVQGSTTDASEVAKYVSLITAQIKQHVNPQVCGKGKPELQFVINLMPTGYLIGKPKLIASNASVACNEAVERAILEAQPLPAPKQADLFSQFRELKLKFRPNEE
jgi:colicin import membrane protein